MVLIGGTPGAGKSTLLLQVIANLATQDISVLYVSGEESLQQIAERDQIRKCLSQVVQFALK
jgi:DNA repair protein RadA/Sms